MPETMKVTRTLEVEVDVEGEYTPGADPLPMKGEAMAVECPGWPEDAEVTGVYLRVAREDKAQGRKWVERVSLPDSMWEDAESDFVEALILAAGSETSERLQDARDHEAVRPGAEGPQVADSQRHRHMRDGWAREACRHCGASRTITNTGSVKDCVPSTIPAPD